MPQQPQYPNGPQSQQPAPGPYGPQPPQAAPGPYGQQPPQAPGPYGQQPPQAAPGPYGQQSPQAPGPYGQQPPQAAPGPYGQQSPQAPGPYGSPYPQQQPYPGAPQPQQPYPAWGAPLMTPPPKKRRIGLILGIVGGVVTLGVVGLMLLGALAESGFPAAKNRLTLPHTLLDQKYTLAEDLSGTEGKKVEDEADGAWDAKDIHAVVGRYSKGGDSGQAMLLVSGMYGRFKNEDSVRRGMLKGATESESVTLAEPAKDATPPGSDVTVACEVLVQKQAGIQLTYPVCSWADGNTAALVAEITLARKSPADVDLTAAARSALKVRSEMIEPVG
ncbi:hypothetical protein OIB37_24775 [Streptomyces sp. NBC_00820]|uniref:hypothetical protein n=1 Tax=Streptomyces sp. NBC_00820 TaxID=2975842 RepID=UPI002ED57ECF|nr:hypothetical protein OIB37_24775 [Streptomyces sp. NBC_00820]